MGILSIYTDTTGQVSVNPRRIKIITTDSLATITTANYLGAEVLSTYAIVPTDIFDIIYLYVATTNSGSYGEFLPTFSNGIVTLSQAPTTGVTLPTIVNHIATYTNTTGQLAEDASTAINGGNIQAGLSGTAGTLASFPGTASKGSLKMVAVANTGNTNTTISNAAMGQASVVSMPDPGTATANFILSDSAGTQHITTGSLSVDVGNMAAGSSGHAGTLSSFPGTASKGSLVLTAVANTGNTLTTISNAAMGQASVVSIPDPATATASFVIAPAALVGGNLVKASGTTGLIADAAFALHAATTGTYAGGGTSNAFTTTNMTSSSIVTATILAQTNTASIVKAVPGTNTLTVTFSADPGANTTVSWISVTPAG